MAYGVAYTLKVTPINAVGLGSTPATLAINTKSAPSAPTIAPIPVKDTVSATLMKITWSGIPTDEDSTGGYPITSY
jgi:hypothetical protein